MSAVNSTDGDPTVTAVDLSNKITRGFPMSLASPEQTALPLKWGSGGFWMLLMQGNGKGVESTLPRFFPDSAASSLVTKEPDRTQRVAKWINVGRISSWIYFLQASWSEFILFFWICFNGICTHDVWCGQRWRRIQWEGFQKAQAPYWGPSLLKIDLQRKLSILCFAPGLTEELTETC